MNTEKHGLLAVLVLVLILFSTACHRTPRAAAKAPPPPPPPPDYFAMGEKYYESGEYGNAVQAYQNYLRSNPAGVNQDRALFHLAMIHAVPGSPSRDMPRAVRLLQQLVSTYPSSQYRPEAEVLLRLQADVDRLRADTTRRDERIKELTREVEKLNRELEKLREIDLQRRPSRVPPQ